MGDRIARCSLAVSDGPVGFLPNPLIPDLVHVRWLRAEASVAVGPIKQAGVGVLRSKWAAKLQNLKS